MGMALKSARSLKKECYNCGSRYNIIEESYPTRDKGSIKCNYCGAVIHEWNGGRICDSKLVSGPTKEDYRKIDE
jgi:predicted Zn finger-like uncharacterized protein